MQIVSIQSVPGRGSSRTRANYHCNDHLTVNTAQLRSVNYVFSLFVKECAIEHDAYALVRKVLVVVLIRSEFFHAHTAMTCAAHKSRLKAGSRMFPKREWLSCSRCLISVTELPCQSQLNPQLVSMVYQVILIHVSSFVSETLNWKWVSGCLNKILKLIVMSIIVALQQKMSSAHRQWHRQDIELVSNFRYFSSLANVEWKLSIVATPMVKRKSSTSMWFPWSRLKTGTD